MDAVVTVATDSKNPNTDFSGMKPEKERRRTEQIYENWVYFKKYNRK